MFGVFLARRRFGQRLQERKAPFRQSPKVPLRVETIPDYTACTLQSSQVPETNRLMRRSACSTASNFPCGG